MMLAKAATLSLVSTIIRRKPDDVANDHSQGWNWPDSFWDNTTR